LINPNQSRVYGISLCDDPFDPFRKWNEDRNRTDYTIIHVWNDILFWFKGAI
jgi:hypothetical protein